MSLGVFLLAVLLVAIPLVMLVSQGSHELPRHAPGRAFTVTVPLAKVTGNVSGPSTKVS